MISLDRQNKLLRLGLASELLARLVVSPSVGASPGALQPGAAPSVPAQHDEEPSRNTQLAVLAPAFSVRLFFALKEVNANKVSMGLFEGLRSSARQTWLYQQGRSRPGTVVTNAATIYNSWHGYGLAADCVPIRDGEWIWPSNGDHIWRQWLLIAQRHGLITGLYWKFTDAPHTQPGYLYSYPQGKDQVALRSFGINQVWVAYDQFQLSSSYIDSL
jgi:hypothetical protein